MKKHLSVEEVAELLETPERTVRSWIAQGYFPGSFKRGPAPNSPWRIPRSDVERYVEKHLTPIGESA